jgi:putative ABC transport system substrate-binding protein
VFVQVSDPLGSNLGASLARPGGNVTGFTNIEFSIAGKWIEILKEIYPRVARVSVMFNPLTAPFAQGYLRLVEEAGQAHGVDVSSTTVRDPADLDAAMAAIAQTSHAGLIVMPDIFMTTHRDRIAVMASKYRVPAIYPCGVSPSLTSLGMLSGRHGQWDTPSCRRRLSSDLSRDG